MIRIIQIGPFMFAEFVQQQPVRQRPTRKQLRQSLVKMVEKQQEIKSKLNQLEEEYETAQNLKLEDDAQACIKKGQELANQAEELSMRQSMIIDQIVGPNKKFKLN